MAGSGRGTVAGSGAIYGLGIFGAWVYFFAVKVRNHFDRIRVSGVIPPIVGYVVARRGWRQSNVDLGVTCSREPRLR